MFLVGERGGTALKINTLRLFATLETAVQFAVKEWKERAPKHYGPSRMGTFGTGRGYHIWEFSQPGELGVKLKDKQLESRSPTYAALKEY